MLRDFQYNPQKQQITEVLQAFDLDFMSEKSYLDLVRYELLSPDSFMWKLVKGGIVYYLYAEDYVSSLQYVKDVFNEYIGSNKWDFVLVRDGLELDASDKAEGALEFAQYSVISGYDYVFLAKTLESPDDAHFPERKAERLV